MQASLPLLYAVIITLTGCASDLPPETPERAPGTFTAINIPALTEQWISGNVQLATKNKNGCGVFPGNILPATIDDDYLVDIEANRDIFFKISRTTTQSECQYSGFFYASKGNEYSVKFEMKGKQCEFSLTEKTPSGLSKKISTYPAYLSNIDGKKVCENKDRLY
jgi:hypothetical protein